MKHIWGHFIHISYIKNGLYRTYLLYSRNTLDTEACNNSSPALNPVLPSPVNCQVEAGPFRDSFSDPDQRASAFL